MSQGTARSQPRCNAASFSSSAEPAQPLLSLLKVLQGLARSLLDRKNVETRDCLCLSSAVTAAAQ